MDRYCKRLIEVDLPIKRISAHARREKNIRHGHISTLHIWWARRPLAACRAVLCASLWPDPADNLCPDHFRDNAREMMQNWAQKNLKLLSDESKRRFISIQKDTNFLNSNEELRAALLDFIADFSNWDNSSNKEYLETSRLLTQVAHETLMGEEGRIKSLLDPFAGGGAIPLEGQRIGLDVFASDLNPVAVLLNKVSIEYIPKYGLRLVDLIRKWGNWINENARKELADYYPNDSNGVEPIAFLWARTIICEGPSCGAQVPLLRTLWLAKKGKLSTALKINTSQVGKNIEFEIIKNARSSEVQDGTVTRGSVTCPVCGYTTPIDSVRRQLMSKKGGLLDARLIAIRQNDIGTGQRTYRLPTEKDITAVDAAVKELERKIQTHNGEFSLIPDEQLPKTSSGFIAPPTYGHETWGSLFTPRQALALSTFARLINKAMENFKEEEEELKFAGQTCLALALDRLADFNSSMCVLNVVGGRGVVHTFGRQALPIVWDFMETNPFNKVGANWDAGIKAFISTIELESHKVNIGQIEKLSASKIPLPDDSIACFFTDPPYYNAVPYADLSDFFYVWLKRIIKKTYPVLFNESLSPKKDEFCEMASWDKHRYPNKDGSWFEKKMTLAMAEGRRILSPNGIGIVVFAHKSTAGWEAFIQALLDAGWIITGSWPIDTERAGRLRAQGSAALASSIHLVCRPRENPDGSLSADEVGDWRDVLLELPKRIHAWVPRLAKEGIVGADAIFACLGPALEIFSRYSSVEKASGEKVLLKVYLEEVWAAIAREALSMIFKRADASGFEEDARLTAMWLWTLRTSFEKSDLKDSQEPDEGLKSLRGYGLDYDAARKIAQGLGAHLENLSHLVEVKGDTATLLTAGARTRYLFGKDSAYVPKGRKKKIDKQMKLNFEEELKELEEEPGDWTIDLSGGAGSTVLDQLHQCMVLFGAGRAEALRRFLVDDAIGHNPLFWRLAQALSALYPAGTNEKRWVDGVLARKKGLGL